ncbi:hypothetical protein Tco_1081015 [Tanacetum coccineum]|uniref:Uncharacterized protein n=1 Tax=Tanacetum coccineum TaxID=301880 RepID=A0ABQ5HWD3_9ASTR
MLEESIFRLLGESIFRPGDDAILDKRAAIEKPRSNEKTAKALLWRLDVWQDVKKHVITNPSDMNAANNSTVDQDLGNTAVEYKCSVDKVKEEAKTGAGVGAPWITRFVLTLIPIVMLLAGGFLIGVKGTTSTSDRGDLRGASISALVGAVLYVEVLEASRAYWQIQWRNFFVEDL